MKLEQAEAGTLPGGRSTPAVQPGWRPGENSTVGVAMIVKAGKLVQHQIRYYRVTRTRRP